MWSTILGHSAQIAQVRQSVAHGVMAPAWLFSGPSGIGKRQVAVALASELTTSPPERIAAGHHPDVMVLAPAEDTALREISIEQIREMRTRLQLHPLEAAVKLVIIDDADTMHPSAANACLKILEEPPSHTHFFLISAQPHRLLPTIRSRCQTIAFGPLPSPVIIQHLIAQGIDPAEARQRALLAEGSVGRAMRFPAEVVAETLTDLHHVLTTPDGPVIFQVAQRWSADAALLPWRLHLMGLLWRDATACRLMDGGSPSLPATTSLIERLTPRSTHRLYREFLLTLHAVHDLADTTLNKQLCCEALLFRLAGCT